MNIKMPTNAFRFLIGFMFFGSFGFISPFKGLNKEKQKPAYLVSLYKICNQFTIGFEKKYNIVLMGPRPIINGIFKEYFDELECDFAAARIGSIEEARKICVLGTQELMKVLNETKILSPKFYEDSRNRERVAVNIRYLDPNRPSKAFQGISHAFQAKNKIFYYAVDQKTDGTVKILEETYDEACKILKDQGVLK